MPSYTMELFFLNDYQNLEVTDILYNKYDGTIKMTSQT